MSCCSSSAPRSATSKVWASTPEATAEAAPPSAPYVLGFGGDIVRVEGDLFGGRFRGRGVAGLPLRRDIARFECDLLGGSLRFSLPRCGGLGLGLGSLGDGGRIIAGRLPLRRDVTRAENQLFAGGLRRRGVVGLPVRGDLAEYSAISSAGVSVATALSADHSVVASTEPDALSSECADAVGLACQSVATSLASSAISCAEASVVPVASDCHSVATSSVPSAISPAPSDGVPSPDCHSVATSFVLSATFRRRLPRRSPRRTATPWRHRSC